MSRFTVLPLLKAPSLPKPDCPRCGTEKVHRHEVRVQSNSTIVVVYVCRVCHYHPTLRFCCLPRWSS
ncbi:MAG: hypothetical protein ACREAW_04890, partial [Nitrososphaera sp.]